MILPFRNNLYSIFFSLALKVNSIFFSRLVSCLVDVFVLFMNIFQFVSYSYELSSPVACE